MDWSLSSINAGLLISLFFGALSGYIASRLLGREGYGCLGNIVVGIIGGFIGTWLVGLLKIPMMSGLPGSFISSVGGAIVFIISLDFLSKKSRGSAVRSRSRR